MRCVSPSLNSTEHDKQVNFDILNKMNSHVSVLQGLALSNSGLLIFSVIAPRVCSGLFSFMNVHSLSVT